MKRIKMINKELEFNEDEEEDEFSVKSVNDDVEP
jgi:hypothetical protein